MRIWTSLIFVLLPAACAGRTSNPVSGGVEGEGEGEGESASEGEREGEDVSEGEREGEGESPESECRETWHEEVWWPTTLRGRLTFDMWTWDRSREGVPSETGNWFTGHFARPDRDYRSGWCGTTRDPLDGVDDCEVWETARGWGEAIATDDDVGDLTITGGNGSWSIPWDGYAYGAVLEPAPLDEVLSIAAAGGEQPAFALVDALHVPPSLGAVAISSTAPALDTSSDLTINWDNGTSTVDDTLVVWLSQYITANGHGINLRCRVLDDGSFTVPAQALAWFNGVDKVSLSVERTRQASALDGAYILEARVLHSIEFAVP